MPAPEREPEIAPGELAELMIDGYQLRYRGAGGAEAPPGEPRVG